MSKSSLNAYFVQNALLSPMISIWMKRTQSKINNKEHWCNLYGLEDFSRKRYLKCNIKNMYGIQAIGHYVAICNPFSYITIMNYRGCVLLWSSPSAFHTSTPSTFSWPTNSPYVPLMPFATFSAMISQCYNCRVPPILLKKKNHSNDGRVGGHKDPLFMQHHLLFENSHLFCRSL